MSQENNEDKKNIDYFILYKNIVDRAQKEIDQVRSVYKWLATLLAIIISFGIFYNVKSASDFRRETREDIKELKGEVEKRVDKELGSVAIQELIQERVKFYIDKNANTSIANQIELNVKPKIDEAENKLKVIDRVLKEMLARSRITQLADRAIAESSRDAYDELEHISEENKEGTPLYFATDAEMAHVKVFWENMGKEKRNLPLKKSDGSFANASDFSTEELKKLLLEDKRWDVRKEAAKYLSDRREEESVKSLVESLEKEKDLEVIEASLNSFYKLTNKNLGILNYKGAIKYWKEHKEEILKILKK
jgi:uncharacterized membrane protein YheB (UPF0754 family)